MAETRPARKYWWATISIAVSVALGSPAFLLLTPEGPVSIVEHFIYLPVGFMLLNTLSSYGLVYAAWYLAQFLVYFLMVLLFSRGVVTAASRVSQSRAA